MSIDQEVLEACEYISSMPNDEFEARWNPPVEPEEKKAEEVRHERNAVLV